MPANLPALGPNPVIVPLPSFDLPDLVPACEVLWQEGFRVWTLDAAGVANLPGLLQLYGRRAKIGVHGVLDVAAATQAAAAGASFLASPALLVDLVTAVPELPVVLGGLTPSELLAGLRAGAAAVQMFPTDAFGTGYARALPPLLPPDSLVAAGRLERYQADIWLDAGALAVWPQDLVNADLVLAENLDELRVKLQKWRLDA